MTSPRPRPIVVSVVLVALLTLAGPVRAQNARPQPAMPSEGADLAYFGEARPVLLRLQVRIDGKPVPAYWNDYIEKWFRYLDVNDDGRLDARELQRAPQEQVMVQLLRQGGFFRLAPASARLTDFKKRDDETVNLAELQAYYRRLLAPVDMVPQASNAALAQASDTLFKTLDANKDGKLSRQELQAASTRLHKVDLDDDEWITLQELSPNVVNTVFRRDFAGTPATSQVGDSFFHIRPDESRLPLLLLARYDRDASKKLSRMETGLDTTAFAGLDTDRDGELDVEELARWHQRDADLEFTVKLGKATTSAVEFTTRARNALTKGVRETVAGVYQIHLGDAEIHLARGDLPQAGGRFNQGQALVQQFRQADVKKQGFLTSQDVEGSPFFRPLFTMVDRDSDGKMTEQELQAFTNLLVGAGDCFVTLSVADQGRALFQLLDANRDNRLSPRELLSAWDRVAHLDQNGNGVLGTSDLVRQFQISVQQGPTNPGGAVLVFPAQPQPGGIRPLAGRSGPEWYRRMDRSGDGEVSFREFLGTREDFQRIDTNGDGLISPDEATRYDEPRRGRTPSPR